MTRRAHTFDPGSDKAALAAAAVDYDRLRALGFLALKKLGSQGYTVPLSDGLELVHDFLVEVVPGLRARFDPAFGAFSTYCFAAFLRFARPRILASRRWRDSLVAPEDLLGALDAIVLTPPAEDHLDLERLRAALHALPSLDRTVLTVRFSSRSERQAARRTQMTRYRFREASCVALGKLFVSLEEPGVLAEDEFRLARALWSEQRTLDEVARDLSRSPREIADAKRRLLVSIGRAFHDVPCSTDTDMPTDLCDLWRSFLLRPGSTEAVRAVRAQRTELLEHLDACDVCDEQAGDLEHAEAVYAALALDEEELPAEERASLDALVRARAEDERTVVAAVQEGLLPSLPPPLRRVEFLEAAAGGRPVELLLFRLLEGVSLMLHRLGRARGAKTVALGEDGVLRVADEVMPADALRLQIVASTGITPELAPLAISWLVAAIGSVPGLIPGTSGTPSGPRSVSVVLEPRDPSANLFVVWRPTPSPAAAALG